MTQRDWHLQLLLLIVLSSAAEIFPRGCGVGVDLICWLELGNCELDGVSTLPLTDIVPTPGGTIFV